LYIEFLDDNNKTVPKGSPGTLVITSLYNKAHPMIRYAIGDVGILGKRSTPKKMFLEQLIGRTNDVAILANGKKIPGLTFYYVTKSIIKDSGSIKEFIVEQKDLQTFIITYVATEVLSDKQIKEIKKALALYVEDNLYILIKKVKVLERSKSGKLKQFISHL
jgi:phenylacetate-CoA ligase